MVPIYSTSAYLGLMFKDYTLIWDIFREFYESVTIYYFLLFLVTYLGGPEKLIILLNDKSQQSHVAPCNYLLPDWTMGATFYYNCRFGVLQYVIVRAICAFITCILIYFGYYGDGTFQLDRGYIYIQFINNASQIWAMYCLILFYLATEVDLHAIRPLYKFICIKAVVFFTFWQALGIALLVKINWVEATQTYSVENASTGLQDFLICIEMFFAAWAHWVSFPYDEFSDPTTTNNNYDKLNEISN